MTGLLTLILVIAVSMLVTKIATVALTHTGMSRENAKFQARSAFTGVGFTTNAAEKIVRHPVRRRTAKRRRSKTRPPPEATNNARHPD